MLTKRDNFNYFSFLEKKLFNRKSLDIESIRLNNNLNLIYSKNLNNIFFELEYKLENEIFAEFWYSIELDRYKKNVKILNYHREVFPKHIGIGSFFLNNFEKNILYLKRNNKRISNYSFFIEFLHLKGQEDTKAWLKKFGYEESKFGTYYKELF